MTVAVGVLALSTIAGAVGVLLIVTSGAPADGVPPPRVAVDRGVATRALVAGGVGVVVLAAAGWLVPAIVVGAASWTAIAVWQRRDRRAASAVERTDAIASWIENLRDVLVAGDQPVGAINATVATCPAAIRPAVRRLAAGLGRQDPAVAFRRFADDLDEPLGDLVAAGLLIAVQRGARTAGVLSSLAEQARRQADRRRLIEAERAPVQREVMLLTLFMGSLVVGLLVFGRADYLRAYDTAGGQLFLAIVLSLYALLLIRVQRLARYPLPARFLTTGAPTSSTPRPTGRPP